MRRRVVLAAARARRGAVARGAATPGFPLRRRGRRDHVDVGGALDARAGSRRRARRPSAGLEARAHADPLAELPRRAPAADDLTVADACPGLRPGDALHVPLLRRDRDERVGHVHDSPAPTASNSVRFAISGDADATPGANGKPAFNRFQVYARWRPSATTSTSTSATRSTPTARSPVDAGRSTVAEKWAKYRLGLALPALRQLRARPVCTATGTTTSSSTTSRSRSTARPIYRAGVKAFRDYSPVTYTPRDRPLSHVPLGQAPRALLPRRALVPQREGHAGLQRRSRADGAAAGAQTRSRRSRPALRNPVAPACLAALDDPARTMLGARQYAAFTKAIRASTATWKVIVNEVPIQQFYALPYDRWEGYAAERERLLALPAGEREERRLPHDRHPREPRRRGPLPGRSAAAPEGTGIWEVVTGPVATNTFAKEIDDFLGQKGAGTAIASLFFKPPPPNGVGMRCAALDTYSYAQVTVTAEATHGRAQGREGPAGPRGDGRRLRPARPDRALTACGRARRLPCQRAPVAQWTERRTSNPRVAGSNPAGRIEVPANQHTWVSPFKARKTGS